MNKVFTFRVLLDYEDDVFRDIKIKGNEKFETLHYLILKSFGFKKGQMASFYKSNDTWDKGEEITLVDMSDGGPDSPLLMSDLSIKEIVHSTGQRLVYVYDFLLMWCFYVECSAVETVEHLDSIENGVVFSHGEAPDQSDRNDDDIMFDGDDEYDFEDDEDGDEDDDDEFGGDYDDGYDEDDLR